jgi:hypothetical protein
MSLREQWKRWRNRPQRKAQEVRPGPSKQDLREFVYLDEVSLRSLLSSLTGEMIEGRSEQTLNQIQAELASTIGASNPLVAKAEVSSRFQTSNSSTIQTSRKATVQSWFREFHAIPKLRLIEPVQPKGPVADEASLLNTPEKSLVASSDDLQRGELVEFKVRLAADPVYHLSTVVSESTGMAADYPDMFAAGNAIASLREIQPINKILERLLAGLIPIRAVAVDYSVVNISAVEYVVHNELLQGIDLKREPLRVVGVTDHLAYWKDLRRVLFADAEFTILGRVARSGLQSSWTPVKLADLFQDFTPGLVDQINAAGRMPFATSQLTSPINANDAHLVTALQAYSTAALADVGMKLKRDEKATLAARIAELRTRSGSASDQRSAFAAVGGLLKEIAGIKIEPARDLELREEARMLSGLSMFPALASSAPAPPRGDTLAANKVHDEHLLDVEVIAIYW